MDGQTTNFCKTCGSTSFEEIDALFYCSVCSAQVAGLTVQVSEFAQFGTLREVKSGPKKRKADDTGVPWTTTEAFNIILTHQCSQLEKNLNLGPQFRVTLFSLWAEYLCKCEIAFTGVEQVKPKVNITSHLRDIQLIDQGLEKVSKPLVASHKPRELSIIGNTRCHRDVTIKTINRNYAQLENNSVTTFDDHHEKENGHADLNENVPSSENLAENDKNLEDNAADNFNSSNLDDDNFLFNYDYQIEPEPINLGIDGNDKLLDDMVSLPARSDQSTIGHDQTVLSYEPCPTRASSEDFYNGLKRKGRSRRSIINKEKKQEIRNILKKFDEGFDYENLISELDKTHGHNQVNYLNHEIEENSNDGPDNDEIPMSAKVPNLSRRSTLIKKIIGENGSNLLRNTDDITVERMTIHKTLQFILLAFRLCKYNVHAGDLTHWINMGFLTFFDAHTLLPEEWILLPGGDINVLHPRKTVHIDSLERRTVILRNFLSIKSFPHPDFNEMIKRHIFELNLPFQLIDIVANTITFNQISAIARGFRVDADSKVTPCYDVYSFISIIVILKKLFILNGKHEFRISKFVRTNFPESFIWENWFDYTRSVWKLMNQHYFPINHSLNNNVPDIEVMRCHRDKISHSWFGIESTSKRYYYTKDYKNNMSKLMDESFEVEECAIELPSFSVYHLHEAKRFIARRLESMNRSSTILDDNFRNKSIDYLFNERYTFIDCGNKEKLVNGGRKIAWDVAWKEWPESLQVLINIGAFILNRSPKEFTPLIWRLDRKIKSINQIN